MEMCKDLCLLINFNFSKSKVNMSFYFLTHVGTFNTNLIFCKIQTSVFFSVTKALLDLEH